MIRMRRIYFVWIFSLITLLVISSMVWADRTVIDISTVPGYTPAEVWISGQTPGNGYSGTGNFYDVIGNQFATDQMTITAANVVPFTIRIWTNNQPGGWEVGGTNWGVADIAINATLLTANYDEYTLQHFQGAVSRFEYGLYMQAYANGTPGQGGQDENVFLGSVSTWATSFSNVNPYQGFKYGGAYEDNISPVETNMIEYTPTFYGNMNWVVNDPDLDFNNTIPDYLITITFPGVFATGEWEYLWGTAKCGNDIVRSEYTPVPEPATMLLLGSGLIGLAGYGRRKFFTK